MFEARFSDGATFKRLIEALKDFKEINFDCDGNGIRLKVLDDCHVSLADMKLSSSFFDHYKCDSKCQLGLNVEILLKVIRQAPNDRPLVLRKADDSDLLRIESDEDVEYGCRRAADIGLISVNAGNLQLPEQAYGVDIEVPTRVFSYVIKDLSGLGEDITIMVTSKTVKFEADGERGRVENVFHRGTGVFGSTLWKFDENCNVSVVQQSFAMRFLSGFVKACPLAETMCLSMSAGIPLRLRFPLGEDSHLSYYIAPALE